MIYVKSIKDNLELFSFPRLSGTKGEKKAFNLALEKLQNLNLNPSIQEFTFSTYLARIYPKIIISIGFFLIFMFYLNMKAIIFPILYLFSIIILLIQLYLANKPENVRIGKKLKSHNLIIKFPPQNQYKDLNYNKSVNSENNILFFCHLDSKSQKISILARIRAAKSWVFSSIILMILIILKNYILIQFSLIFYIIGIIPLAINLIASLLLLFNTTGNISQGAIDNASGISCVLELLQYYLEPSLRLRNFNLWFVFTGAEECGTMGIRYFYQKIKDLDRNKSIIFNFDAIANSVCLFPGKNINNNIKTLYNAFINNSKGLNIQTNSKRFYIGSHSDGYYLKKKGFKGFGIGDMESYKFIHSINDTLDKIDTSVIKKLCEVIIMILKDYDTNFNIS